MTRGRDLKLRRCLDGFAGVDFPLLKTEAIRSVSAAYERNIRRVHSLVLFAPAAIWMAIVVQRHSVRIETQFPKKDERTRIALIDQAIRKEMELHRRIFEKGGEAADHLLDEQHKISFQMLSSQSEEYSDGPEAWMASQMIATWTAFESMAGDLWEVSLNTKPEILSKLSGRKQAKRSDSDDSKRIKLDWLHKYKFDLSRHMGTIFIEDKRYAFDSLSGIRQAYSDAFSVDYDDIDKIMIDKSFDALSLIRNNLVHNGGIIDHRYRSRFSDLPIEAHGELGDPIQIDGELVAKIIGHVVKGSRDLIVAVDCWLAAH